jgi:hypothetical protein
MAAGFSSGRAGPPSIDSMISCISLARFRDPVLAFFVAEGRRFGMA